MVLEPEDQLTRSGTSPASPRRFGPAFEGGPSPPSTTAHLIPDGRRPPWRFEDLARGAGIATADGETAPLMVERGDHHRPRVRRPLRESLEKLYRGDGRTPSASDAPARDVLSGPRRLLTRDPSVRAAVSADAAYVPVSSLADGVSVIEG